MEYIAARVAEMLSTIAWKPSYVLRIFWVQHSAGSRNQFAEELPKVVGAEGIVAIPVRDAGFQNANAIFSDVQRLFADNKPAIEALHSLAIQRLSIILIGKSDFQLPQGSSHITLPRWFPVDAGRETFFEIADLGMTAEAALLNCPEARLDQIAEFTYNLETAITDRLAALQSTDRAKLDLFVSTAHNGIVPDSAACVREYSRELAQCASPRAYRPKAAKESKALIARLLRLVLNISPKQLSGTAEKFAECFSNADHIRLKPPLFAVMLRPATEMSIGAANWHSIMLALYQAYQLMNGAAHADEYPHYSVALQFASSVDLRTFLAAARQYVDTLG